MGREAKLTTPRSAWSVSLGTAETHMHAKLLWCDDVSLQVDIVYLPSPHTLMSEQRPRVSELLLANSQAGRSVNTAPVSCSVFDVWSICSRQSPSSGLGCYGGTLEGVCVVIGRVPSHGISSYSPQPLMTNQQASDVAFPHTQERSGWA